MSSSLSSILAHGMVFPRRALPPRRVLLPLRILLPVAAGLALLAPSAPNAAEGRTFVIDDSEGYGITDCLKGDKACGKVVADAWCEAHGFGPAKAFGKAEDITASIAKIAPNEPAPSDPAHKVIVRCEP